MKLKTSLVITIIILQFLQSCSTNAIETALLWSNMNPIPASATNVNVEVKGGMFTREFIITFNCKTSDIEKWIKNSPGTKDVKPEIHNNIKTYNIKPNDGAQFAQVEYYIDEQKIIIRTYWS